MAEKTIKGNHADGIAIITFVVALGINIAALLTLLRFNNFKDTNVTWSKQQ